MRSGVHAASTAPRSSGRPTGWSPTAPSGRRASTGWRSTSKRIPPRNPRRKEAAVARENKPNELTLTRIYDAPVEAVWEAWTDEKQVAQWWGPRGFSLTTHSKDLRPGGHWRYTMHGPDGVDYPNDTHYHEVEKHSRLVYDHG